MDFITPSWIRTQTDFNMVDKHIYIVQGEIATVVGAIKRNSRTTHTPLVGDLTGTAAPGAWEASTDSHPRSRDLCETDRHGCSRGLGGIH
ncbi:hypothetical protein AALO_G00229450 [Alosa alosa]|uniref:Uncharacterized protein n=1 Tax=Alosa alosa TaxID=278164 RepID=A0AAV6FY18_9TELE|nr:hypothetical protein AALO_G00229450 [Alosa alosa]